MNVLGITLGHDSSFALVSDGVVVGILEAERFFRQKRYKLDCQALKPGKRISGYQYVDISDLQDFLDLVTGAWGKTFDALAVQNQGRVEEFKNLLSLLETKGFAFKETFHLDHHLCHAALAFYTSPFPEAVVLSYDGVGNDGFTIFFRAGGEEGLKYLELNDVQFGRNYNNLGYIIGIRPEVCGTSSGKTMGLTAYGEVVQDWLPYARRYVSEYRKLPPRPIDGLADFGKSHRINSIGLDEIPDLQDFLVPAQPVKPGSMLGSLRQTARKIAGREKAYELRLPGPKDRTAQSLVRTVQAAWTEQVLALLEPYAKVSRNLCIVGGCALNGITNYAVEQSGLFQAIHLVPNPSDCGLSAGAGLYVHHRSDSRVFEGSDRYFSPYLGEEPFDRDQLPGLKQKYPHRELPPQLISQVIARLVWEDRLVGVIRGRFEAGPRALGNRSILCNPLHPEMRDILNQKVKHREWYRPFAPIITADDAQRFFTNTSDIPYMSVICYTRPEYRDRLPAITHVDGSARLQTIRRDQLPFMYDTLKEFEKLSGMPIMLNTSFNPGGEPILNFYAVGLEMLETTDLDLVLIDNTLFCRPGREALLDF